MMVEISGSERGRLVSDEVLLHLLLILLLLVLLQGLWGPVRRGIPVPR